MIQLQAVLEAAEEVETFCLKQGWAATVMSPCGVVNCKVLGPQGPLLTNRMTELVTCGSVGGVGRKPGPYPAVDGGIPRLFSIRRTPPAATDPQRSP